MRWIHSVASDSALEQLGQHGGPQTQVLVEVNVARDESKSGVLPEDLDGFLERCPVERRRADDDAAVHRAPGGQPPLVRGAGASWRASAGLRELSMGTSQDYAVAAQEGATIVRLGTSLYT